MGKTSSAVKDRYNAKAYDELKARLPKGMKAEFQAICEANGDSMNSVVVAAVKAYIRNNKASE